MIVIGDIYRICGQRYLKLQDKAGGIAVGN